MPTPSMTASIMALLIALLRIALAPPRTPSTPPVQKPPRMEFHGSSFFLAGKWLAYTIRQLLHAPSCTCVPDALDSAIEGRKEATPDAAIAAKDW
jgi:hypothetical protein